MFMSICSIDNELNVWHMWLDNNAKSVTNVEMNHLRVVSSQHGKDFRNSITISASYMQMHRGSASLVLKISFNIVVTIGCLPNSILSFTGRMLDSMLLAVLIAEYPIANILGQWQYLLPCLGIFSVRLCSDRQMQFTPVQKENINCNTLRIRSVWHKCA